MEIQDEFEDRWISLPSPYGGAYGWLLIEFRHRVLYWASFVPSRYVLRQDRDGEWSKWPPGQAPDVGDALEQYDEESDHEHCDSCWYKFMATGDDPVTPGWTDASGTLWLCEECHAAMTHWWATNPAAAL